MYGRFRDIRCLSKRIGIYQAVVRSIGRTKSRELISMFFPWESAAIHNRTSHLHTMAIHVFSGTMRYDIRTPLYRSATYRRRKRVVHYQGHSMLMRDARKTFDIEHAHARITQGLAKYEFGIFPKSRLQLLIARFLVNERHLDTHFLKRGIEKIIGTTIDGSSRYHVVARFADIEAGKEIGSLTAGGQHSSYSTLKRCNLSSNSIVGGVLQTRIEIATLFKVKQLSHLVAGFVFEGCALYNRQLARLAFLRRIAGLHALRAYLSFLHIYLYFEQKRAQNYKKYLNFLLSFA